MTVQAVAIDGIGLATPFGNYIDECMEHLGKNLDRSNLNSKDSYLLDKDYPSTVLTEREKKRHSRLSIIVLETVIRCINNANMDINQLSNERTAIVSASCLGALDATDASFRAYYSNNKKRGLNPVEFSKATHSFPLSAVATHLGIKGPTISMVSQNSVGLDAMGMAKDLILSGKADRVILIAYEELPKLAVRMKLEHREFELDISSNENPICESCVAFMLCDEKLFKNDSNGYIARLESIVSCYASSNNIKRIKDNFTYASQLKNRLDERPRYVVCSNKEDDETHKLECEVVKNELEKSLNTKKIIFNKWSGNYLCVTPFMNICLILGSITHNKNIIKDENVNFKNSRLLLNTVSKGGNFTTASITISAS